IYTPDNILLLNNHLFLEIYQLVLYHDLPLKSQTYPTTNIPLNLNIITHNVIGLNNITKKQLWEDFCITNNFNIISLTETKLTDSKTKFFNTNHFSYHLTNSDTSREGTGIMISNYLKSHIYKIQKHKGGAIAIDLFFKNDFKFRIISVYLSSGDIIRRNKTQTKVIQWIQQAQTLKLHPIVLGDFNIDNSQTKPSHSKSRLINFLQANNLYDLAYYTNNYLPTWHNNQLSSKINYIWCYQPL